MKFTTNDICSALVEINTMAELQAFALGGNGKIEINFLNRNPLTGSITMPLIKRGEDSVCRDSDETHYTGKDEA